MTLTDRIKQQIKSLPVPLQAEVLDFVGYLLARTERREESDWSDLSLSLAMRDMEDEDEPLYTPADVKITFR